MNFEQLPIGIYILYAIFAYGVYLLFCLKISGKYTNLAIDSLEKLSQDPNISDKTLDMLKYKLYLYRKFTTLPLLAIAFFIVVFLENEENKKISSTDTKLINNEHYRKYISSRLAMLFTRYPITAILILFFICLMIFAYLLISIFNNAFSIKTIEKNLQGIFNYKSL